RRGVGTAAADAVSPGEPRRWRRRRVPNREVCGRWSVRSSLVLPLGDDLLHVAGGLGRRGIALQDLALDGEVAVRDGLGEGLVLDRVDLPGRAVLNPLRAKDALVAVGSGAEPGSQ